MENGNKDLILIIEDDDAISDILKFFLLDKGYDIATAENGCIGLEQIERQEVSLILCDIMMPQMDGYQTLESIRLLFNHLEMPVIMMTAKNKEEDIIKAFELGANDYITKPFNFHVLMSRIQTHLSTKHINKKLTEKSEQLQKSSLRLEKILDNAINFVGFTQSLNCLDREKLFKNLRRLLPAIFNIEYFSLFLYNQKSEELILTAHNHSDWDKLTEPFVVKKNSGGIMWDAIKEKNLIRLKEFSKSKYLPKNNESNKKYTENTICIPLIIDDKVVGALNLNNFNNENMTSEHIANIKMVTNHLAMTYSNLILHKQIEELAVKDELTGLYNRRYLFSALTEKIKETIRYKHNLSLLMLDLDFFKKINDIYGHDNGDVTLKTISALVLKLLRNTDIFCRYGGEEFIIILPHTPLENTKIIAERIRQEVEKSEIILTDGKKISITVSIGLSEYIENDDSDTLIKRADNLLYKSKENGRNRISY